MHSHAAIDAASASQPHGQRCHCRHWRCDAATVQDQHSCEAREPVFLGDGIQFHQGFEQFFHAIQRPRVGAIGQRLGWIRVGFGKQTRNTDRHRSARQHRHELALAARAAALPARQLHRMGRIKHHRTAGVAHHAQRAHVADQIVVAERGATLADHDLRVAGGLGLVHHRLHVPRRQELPLLDVDRLAGGADVLDEIGLPHQEGRGLQHVDDGRDLVHRGVFVHVGEYRHADLPLHRIQHLEAFFQARATEAGAGGAVGLVETRLEDEVDTELAGDLLELAGHVELQLHRLDHAGAGDQEQRLIQANFKATQFHQVTY
ncbi:hypothetical protein XOO2965 [Xanthomonas oryzae pv. oryzae KACC 10331]|uniref:Uncharacterized protein n=1 Tax=Xanthomonas oryzae pv. oryzae (strain KACC10331 / KXO85) TaxID=291331 RepID=Q5GYK2_XANOR|nr:hypothetical protein XOO2965 [Xanthomonas oryzae pv. oryzae KACC 10331]